MTNKNLEVKLSLAGLTGIVISSMVGSGVFSLPQNMASGAGAGAVLLAWIITIAGMYFIMSVFRLLSVLKPQIVTGVYAYAQDGFGKKAGFLTLWGYWLSAVVANTGYAVILMESLNYFFPPYFAGGNNLNSLLLSSCIIWGFFWLASRGIKTAVAVNLIGTVSKFVPLLIFITACAAAFKLSLILLEVKSVFSGKIAAADLLAQIKSTMLITLWCFIGIETAFAISASARSQGEVSKATFLGFLISASVYVLISLLPFGVLPRERLAAFANPSTAGVLEALIGHAGGAVMALGLIVSVLFSWLSWFIISAEVPFAAVKNGAALPSKFAVVNRFGAPVVSLAASALISQIIMALAFFSGKAWEMLVSVTGVMILPVYLITAVYLFKITSKKRFARAVAALGAVYSLWLLYAADLKYLLMGLILFLLGAPVFIFALRERGKYKNAP
ncbi:MAG: basic amino acid/polyamine antiporter [Elusimicrobiota bacterium]|jgi:arginine:ornithine antiporter/lysine permease|nr:basic amino acid/polyamine antiporter [Elusimicrobiota bacterium]